MAPRGHKPRTLAHGRGLPPLSKVRPRAPSVPVATGAAPAGDSALAGYLLARLDGAEDADALARAVAYGTACVLLPGANVPQPEQAAAVTVLVSSLTA